MEFSSSAHNQRLRQAYRTSAWLQSARATGVPFHRVSVFPSSQLQPLCQLCTHLHARPHLCYLSGPNRNLVHHLFGSDAKITGMFSHKTKYIISFVGLEFFNFYTDFASGKVLEYSWLSSLNLREADFYDYLTFSYQLIF